MESIAAQLRLLLHYPWYKRQYWRFFLRIVQKQHKLIKQVDCVENLSLGGTKSTRTHKQKFKLQKHFSGTTINCVLILPSLQANAVQNKLIERNLYTLLRYYQLRTIL